MGNRIRAIIGKAEAVRKMADDWKLYNQIEELPQGFAAVHVNTVLTVDVEDAVECSEERCGVLKGLEGAVVELLEHYSVKAKLVYIENEYFGGRTHGGVLYDNGCEAIPPRVGEGTINALLSELGVRCEAGKDEFNSLGLGDICLKE